MPDSHRSTTDTRIESSDHRDAGQRPEPTACPECGLVSRLDDCPECEIFTPPFAGTPPEVEGW